MTYILKFDSRAFKEWGKLAPTIKEQFKKKLAERLNNPHVPSAKLRGSKDRYKIKLRTAGYRLVYQVDDNIITLLVIAVGRRDGDEAYRAADLR